MKKFSLSVVGFHGEVFYDKSLEKEILSPLLAFVSQIKKAGQPKNPKNDFTFEFYDLRNSRYANAPSFPLEKLKHHIQNQVISRPDNISYLRDKKIQGKLDLLEKLSSGEVKKIFSHMAIQQIMDEYHFVFRGEGLQAVSLKQNVIKMLFFEDEPFSFTNFSSCLYYFFLVSDLGEDLFFLHAAAFIRKGKALMFLGPSGAGKSTVIQLASQYPHISDENLLIRKQRGEYMVYRYPFLTEKESGTAMPLSKIYFLKQDSDNFVDKAVSFTKASRAVFKQLLFLREKKACLSFLKGKTSSGLVRKRALDFVCSLVKDVPCADLHFTRSRAFLRYI